MSALPPKSGRSAALEFLDPRSHFHFPGPSTARLAKHVPIVCGNRIGIKHRVWSICWLNPPCAANAPVDHKMRDVDALRRQFASQTLCEAAQCKLAHRERYRQRIGFNTRRCAGEKNCAMPVREHAARCLLGNQKTPKRADGDSLRNIGGGQIYKYTTHAAHGSHSTASCVDAPEVAGCDATSGPIAAVRTWSAQTASRATSPPHRLLPHRSRHSCCA